MDGQGRAQNRPWRRAWRAEVRDGRVTLPADLPAAALGAPRVGRLLVGFWLVAGRGGEGPVLRLRLWRLVRWPTARAGAAAPTRPARRRMRTLTLTGLEGVDILPAG